MSTTKRLTTAERRSRRIRTGTCIAAIAVLLITAGVIYLQKQVRQNLASGQQDVLSAEVTTGSISTTVSGSGSLVSDGITEVTLPAGVEIKKLYVEAGDRVGEGQLLTSVDPASVLTALSEVQTQLDELDGQLAELSDHEADAEIKTAVKGRVKAIFAAEGDSVADVMYEKGALVLLSLDGYMAVELESTAYSVGDAVTVTASDGTEYSGSVARVAAGITTVLVPDDGPLYQDTVTVGASDSGTLAIHEPLRITGYVGTVEALKVSENDEAEASDVLLTLTDTTWSANYDSLLAQRRELETELQTLVDLYQAGTVLAPAAGTVESLSESAGQGETVLLTIDPGKTMTVTISVDETNVLSLRENLTAEITLEALKGQSFTGTVTGISRTGTNEGGNTKFSVTVELPRQENLLVGMNASVKITTAQTGAAAAIPAVALIEDGSRTYVYTSYDESSDTLGGLVEVETGISDGTLVEILSVLEPGDTVWYRCADTMNYNFFSRN